MFVKIDMRLGGELGLAGRYAELQAFQIVNDAHDLLAGLTSRLITLEYGGRGELYRDDPLWTAIEEKRSQFAQRVNGLRADAVQAAALSDEIRAFTSETLEPFVAARRQVAP